MTASRDETYLLPPAAVDELRHVATGGLRPVMTMGAKAEPFVLLDCFDRSLRRSNRLLMESGERLELVAASGRVLSQPTAPERFVGRFAAGPVKRALADVSPLRRLLPVAEGRMTSGELSLIDDEGKTRARAALRLLAAEGARNGVLLVTLQGLRGYDKALAELRERIGQCGGHPLRNREAYRALVAEDPADLARAEINIGREDSALDAVTDLIHGHLAIARANEDGVIADLDTEFLHQYRVALRKLRSILSLFGNVYAQAQGAELKGRFSALMAPTGRLRDLDVQLLERDAFHDLLPEVLHPGLDAMFDRLAREREQAQTALARHLRGDAYRAEAAALQRLFSARRHLRPGTAADLPALELAAQLIGKRYRKVLRVAREIGPDTPDTAIHDLRIHCKKLRYLMELFATLLPQGALSAAVGPLKKLQNTLGLFNDYSVQQTSLRHFAATLSGAENERLEIAQSVGALIAALHQRQLAERGRVDAALSTFDDAATKTAFRDLTRQKKDDA